MFSVGRKDESRLIGSMLGEDGDSDLDSSLEYNNEGDTDSEIDLNDENLLNDPAANVEALYNFSENARKSAKPKNYQSDEDF